MLRYMQWAGAVSYRRLRAGSDQDSATFLLEPAGGGGDHQILLRAGRVVEQVKARGGGGTWSLAEVIEKVLPDLYLAVDAERLDDPAVRYNFVTEGRPGRWEAAAT
jgi:hypothetical protein